MVISKHQDIQMELRLSCTEHLVATIGGMLQISADFYIAAVKIAGGAYSDREGNIKRKS